MRIEGEKVLFSKDVRSQSVTQTRIVFRAENDRPEKSLSELRREVRRTFKIIKQGLHDERLTRNSSCSVL